MKAYKKIIDTLYQNNIIFFIDEPLKAHTSIKIGGKAKIFVNVKTQKELLLVLNIIQDNDTKYYVLGAGTNTLARDEDFDGVVVCTKLLNRYKVSNNGIYAECGLNLFVLGKLLKANNLKGLEFAYGIPGSVGGAICMNAGAYEHSVGEVVDYVKVVKNGRVKKLSKDKMEFSYRNSIANKDNLIVIGAKFVLQRGVTEDIDNQQKLFFGRRLSNQPYSELSFGSVFKRNSDFEPISKLIDGLGLKGYRIGGAEISKKHAGFIINIGDATCQDCLLLIKYIQEKVFENYGFVPELEVKLLGE